DVAPATESLCAVIVWPVLFVRSSAVRGGYGLQSQFVPRGTESPRAVTDSGVAGAPTVEAVEAAADDSDDAPEHADTTSPIATRPTSAHAVRRMLIGRV